jgi:hypothetical protein
MPAKRPAEQADGSHHRVQSESSSERSSKQARVDSEAQQAGADSEAPGRCVAVTGAHCDLGDNAASHSAGSQVILLENRTNSLKGRDVWHKLWKQQVSK